MDACTSYFIIIAIIFLAACFGIPYYMETNEMNRYNEAVRKFANSIVTNGNPASNNTDLMSQMSPSDEVRSYIEYNYVTNQRSGIGYIAVTDERFVFKAVSMGDHSTSMGTMSGMATAHAGEFNLFANMKEETCNVPITKVSSMSMTDEVIDYHDRKKKPNGQVEHVYILTINAEGILYRLFLAKNRDVAQQFTRTFTSMNRNNE